MKKIMSNILMGIVIIEVLLFIFFGFQAYFMIKVGENNIIYDGLGRQIYESPWFIKMIYRDFQYPGLKWFIIDIILFWIAIGIGSALIKTSIYLKDE